MKSTCNGELKCAILFGVGVKIACFATLRSLKSLIYFKMVFRLMSVLSKPQWICFLGESGSTLLPMPLLPEAKKIEC